MSSGFNGTKSPGTTTIKRSQEMMNKYQADKLNYLVPAKLAATNESANLSKSISVMTINDRFMGGSADKSGQNMVNYESNEEFSTVIERSSICRNIEVLRQSRITTHTKSQLESNNCTPRMSMVAVPRNEHKLHKISDDSISVGSMEDTNEQAMRKAYEAIGYDPILSNMDDSVADKTLILPVADQTKASTIDLTKLLTRIDSSYLND